MAILNTSFKVIAISEKRFSKLLPILNLEIPGCTFPFNETECSARDTSIYVAKKLDFKSCSDHSSSVTDLDSLNLPQQNLNRLNCSKQ